MDMMVGELSATVRGLSVQQAYLPHIEKYGLGHDVLLKAPLFSKRSCGLRVRVEPVTQPLTEQVAGQNYDQNRQAGEGCQPPLVELGAP